jgi:type II secretory pathway pseudopilin PulG
VRDADSHLVRKRLRSEGGFGLVELLLAMLMLNIGLLAVVAALSSGFVSLNRASRITTASVLADQQMELYRALTYGAIRLDSTAVSATDTKYRDDPTIGGNTALLLTASCSGPPDECNPSRITTGADRKPYRLDTYIVSLTPTGGRAVKKVVVVVRDAANLAVTFVRQASTFDQSTG